ncbi:BON domain-containing protein, partial [Oleiphilus sp. HI0080]|uniref:BON domain-containing protein n=1 Tax=Oleiphilus sp. HI0080 TaxID=1822255 RepID=UPI000A3DE56F
EAPINEQLVDARVDAVLAMKLLLENEVTSKNIDIETEDGVVILSGSVPTQAEADLAIAIANNTSGVEKVESKLEVES